MILRKVGYAALLKDNLPAGFANGLNGTAGNSVSPGIKRPRESGRLSRGLSLFAGDVEIDSGLLNVTIAVPPDFVVEGRTQEQTGEPVKEKGYNLQPLTMMVLFPM